MFSLSDNEQSKQSKLHKLSPLRYTTFCSFLIGHSSFETSMKFLMCITLVRSSPTLYFRQSRAIGSCCQKTGTHTCDYHDGKVCLAYYLSAGLNVCLTACLTRLTKYIQVVCCNQPLNRGRSIVRCQGKWRDACHGSNPNSNTGSSSRKPDQTKLG